LRTVENGKLLGLIVYLLGLCSCTYASAPPKQPPVKLLTAPVTTSPTDLQAQSPLSSRLRARQAKAEELMQQADLAAALVQWKILHTLAPGDAEFSRQLNTTQAMIQQRVNIHMQLGEQAFSRGDSKRAKQEFLRVLALDPQQLQPQTYLRRIEQRHLKNVQRIKLAKLASLKQTAISHPAQGQNHQSVPPAKANLDHLEVGLQRLRQGDFETSIQALRTYLATSPQSHKAKQYLAEAHFQLGRSLYRQGNLPDTLAHFEAARKIDPSQVPQIRLYIRQIKHALADEYYHKGLEIYQADPDKAIQLWQVSLSYNAHHTHAQQHLENAYRLQYMLQRCE
jgi:tetratricopeptide (TPR) repeat protein